MFSSSPATICSSSSRVCSFNVESKSPPPGNDPRCRGLLTIISGWTLDRYTILSTTALDTLVPYLRTYRPVSWLFPGAIAGRPITASTIGAVMWHAKKRAGITKRVSVHSLRHNSESPIIPSSLSSVGESLALRRIALGIIRGSSEKQGACHPAGSDGSLCRTVRPWREPFL